MKQFCQHCDEPLPDMGTLCYGCTAKLVNALRSVPDLMDDLMVTFAKRSRTPQPDGPATQEMDPVQLPYNLGASRARAEITGILISWAMLVRDERIIKTETVDDAGNLIITSHGTPITCQPTATALSGWLLQYTGWIRHHAAAADMLTEVRSAVGWVRRIVDIPQPMHYVGPCGNAGCTTDVWGKDGDTTVVCRGCGTTVELSTRWTENIAAAYDVVAYPQTVARTLRRNGLPLTVELIYLWRNRGLITPHSRNPATGRTMYRVGDVHLVAEAQAQKRRNRATP